MRSNKSGGQGLILLLALVIWPALGFAAKDDPATLDWRTLSLLDYQNGKYPPELGALDGKTVKLPGFAVPLEMSGSKIAEFVLVPQFGMCIHVPPPPPNQLVFVKMQTNAAFGDLLGPLWITGTLKIVSTDSVFGQSSFTLQNAQAQPFQ